MKRQITISWVSEDREECLSLYEKILSLTDSGKTIQTVIPITYHAPTLTGLKNIVKALIIYNED